MRTSLIALFALSIVLSFVGQASALDVTVSQAGSDSDEIMKSRAFTVEASGWDGDCTTAILSFSGCSGCSLSGEAYTKTVGEETSVIWTTVTASQKASAQSVSVTMNGCSEPTGYSSGFDVVLPPTLSITAETSTTSVDSGSTFPVDITIVNSGETSANDVSIAVSGGGLTISSGCSDISSLAEEQSVAQPCTVLASSGGSKTVTFTVSAANADDATDSFSMTVVADDDDDLPGGGNNNGGSLGGAVPGAAVQNRTRAQALNPGTGLMNNTRLQAAMEKVLGQARMSEQARQNLMDLSARITGEFSSSHGFTYDGTKSRIRNTVRYAGTEKVKKFMLFEKVPKEFAQSASLVTVSAPGASVEVAEEDPSWVILYPEVSPGQELTVTYEVTGVKSGDVLDNVTMEVYAESTEDVPAAGDTGGDEVPGEETSGGGNAPGGTGFPSISFDMNTMLMIGAGVLGIVVIAAAAILLRGRKGGRKSPAASAVESVKQDIGRQAGQRL